MKYIILRLFLTVSIILSITDLFSYEGNVCLSQSHAIEIEYGCKIAHYKQQMNDILSDIIATSSKGKLTYWRCIEKWVNESQTLSELLLALDTIAETSSFVSLPEKEKIREIHHNLYSHIHGDDVTREPRPPQVTVESEEDVQRDLLHIPQDVFIDRDLTVGNDVTIRGDLEVLGTAPGSFKLENILIVTQGTPQNNQQFNTVKAALDAIGTTFAPSAPDEQYLIQVGPGSFVEEPLDLKPFVTIEGVDSTRTMLVAQDPSRDFIIGANQSTVCNLGISGATGTGSAAVRFDGGGVLTLNQVMFGDNYTHVAETNTLSPTSVVLASSLSISGTSSFTKGFTIDSAASGRTPSIMVLNGLNWGVAGPIDPFDYLFEISGPVSTVVLEALGVGGVFASIPGNGIRITNGSECRISASVLSGFDETITIPNIGLGPTLTVVGSLIRNAGTFNFNLQNPDTVANLSGVFERDKVDFDTNAEVAVSALDQGEGRSVNIGPRLAGDTVGQVTNISEQTNFASDVGVIFDRFDAPQRLVVNSPNTGDVTVPAGSGYVADDTTGKIKFVEWVETVLGPFPADTNAFISIDNNGTPISGGSNGAEQILLGSVVTDSNQRIAFVKQTPDVIDNTNERIESTLRLAFGNIVESGLLVTENGSNPGRLDVIQGTYIFGSKIYAPTGGTTVTWGQYFQDSNNDTALENESLTNDTVPAEYNVPGDPDPLQPIPTGEFARHAFYVVGEGVDEQYLLQYGTTTFSSVQNAQNGSIPPRPSSFSGNVVLIASIIVDDAGNIQEVLDERPRIGFTSSQVSSVSDHGNLSGLFDDDHPQYLHRDGRRPMVGTLDLQNNDITNVEKLSVEPAPSAEGIEIGSTTGNAISINNASALTVKGDDGSLNIGQGHFIVDGDTGNTTVAGDITMSSGGDVDMNGGNVTDISRVSTSDNRDLTLDPGANNNFFIANLRDNNPQDAILVYDTSTQEVTHTSSLSASSATIDTVNATTVNTDNLDPNNTGSITLSGPIDANGFNLDGVNTLNASTVNTDNLDPNAAGNITLSGPIDANGNAITDLSGDSLVLTGDGNGVDILSGDNLNLGGDDINNVGTINATRINTDNLDPNATGSITLSGPIDASGFNITNANMINTSDNRDLTLDPGANNNFFIQNLRQNDPDDAILVYDTSTNEVTYATSFSTSSASIDTVNATRVNTDNLDPNNTGSITLSGPIDANDFNVNGVNTLNASTVNTDNLDPNAAGNITLSGPIDANGNAITDLSGDSLVLTGDGNGVDILSGDNLNLGGDDINNVGTINATRINTDNLDPNATGSITLSGPIDASGFNITNANTINTSDNRDLTLDPGANNNFFIQNLRQNDPDDAVLVYDTNTNEVTYATSFSTSSASIDTVNATRVNTDNLDPNNTGSITLSGPIDANGNAITDTSGNSLELNGNGNGVLITSGDNLDLGGDDINNVGTVNATTVNTDNLDPNATGSITLSGPIDANGFNITNADTITTSDNRNLRLDPGSNNNFFIENLRQNDPDDAVLVYDTGTNEVTYATTLSTSSGGIGLNASSASDGQLLIGNGSGFALSTLTEGSGIDITNGSGSITITASGDVATTYDADSGSATPSSNTITFAGGTNISSTASGSTVTYNVDSDLNSIDSLQFSDGGSVQTAQSAGDTYTLDAFDTNAGSFTSFITLTAGDPPALQFNNLPTQEDSVLTRNSSGDIGVSQNFTTADSTTSNVTVNNVPLDIASGTLARSGAANAALTVQTPNSAGTLTDMLRLSRNASDESVLNAATTTLNIQTAGTNRALFDASGLQLDGASNQLSTSANDLILNGASNVRVDSSSTLDVQSGTVTNSGGSLTVQTGGAGNDLIFSPSGNIDVNGNTITDAGIINTNDARNLTLNPGSNQRLNFQNMPTQEDNVLTIDSNGNVGISSSDSGNIGGTTSSGFTHAFIDSRQQITSTGTFVVEFNQTTLNDGNNFDTTSHAYTAPVDGVYSIATDVNYIAGENQERNVQVQFDDGSGFTTPNGYIIRNIQDQTGEPMPFTFSGIIRLNAGDQIRIVLEALGQTSGANTDRDYIAPNSSVSIYRLA